MSREDFWGAELGARTRWSKVGVGISKAIELVSKTSIYESGAERNATLEGHTELRLRFQDINSNRNKQAIEFKRRYSEVMT